MMRTIKEALLISQKQKHSRPQSLIFFITSRCNAKCDFCLYYDRVDNPVLSTKELTPGEVEKIAKNYGQLTYLALSGGEPFIRNDLLDLCHPFIRHCHTSVVDIPSNFYYTDKMMRFTEGFLKEYPHTMLDLQFSVDNLFEKHDKSRKVNGLFNKAIYSFKKIKELQKYYRNLKLKVNIVYLPENKSSLRSIYSFLSSELSPDRIQLTYPNERLLTKDHGRMDHINDYLLAVKHLEKLHRPSRTDLYTLGMHSAKYVYQKLLHEAAQGKRNTGSYCEAGRHIIVINEVGDVFPCEPLWEPIGNLRESDYNINTLLDSDKYEHFRDLRLGEGKCNCTWGCAFSTETSVKPKYLLSIAQVMIQQVIR